MPHEVRPPTTPHDDDRLFTDLQTLYTAPQIPEALRRNGAAEVRQRFAASRANRGANGGANGSPRARWFVAPQGERPSRATAFAATAAVALICLLAVALFQWSNLSGTSHAGGVGFRATPDHAQATQTAQASMGIPPLSLSSVAMISATDGWAFGSSLKDGCLVLHYDGESWKRSVGSACASVTSISMVSADDGWALATAYSDGQAQEILHYMHGAWQVQATFPVPTAATPQVDWPQQWYDLTSIAMTSPTDGWAVGGRASPNYEYNDHALILHYASGHWTPTPITGLSPAQGARLTSIAMVSANEGWAVGYDYDPSVSDYQSYMLVLHYLNGTWSRVAWTHAGALNGVDTLPTGDMWAVGTADMGQTSAVLHLHDGAFVSLLEPVPGSLNAVQMFSTPAGVNGWAVGDGAATVHDQASVWTRTGYTIHQYTISSLSLLSPTEGWAVGQAIGADAHTSPDWAATLFHLHNGVWSIYPTTGI